MADRLGWNPFRAMRERPHIRFFVAPLPDVLGGAVLWPRGRYSALIVDPKKRRRERNEATAHELVHDEHPEWSEPQVRGEVARRLVPFDELGRMRAWAIDNDLTLDVWQIAEAFDVTDGLAEHAMTLLLSERSAAG